MGPVMTGGDDKVESSLHKQLAGYFGWIGGV